MSRNATAKLKLDVRIVYRFDLNYLNLKVNIKQNTGCQSFSFAFVLPVSAFLKSALEENNFSAIFT